MTRFRPCIDLHNGSVKQIVGGTLTERSDELQTNFISQHPATYFAQLYKDKDLTGGHVIMLGPGNESAAKEALLTWPKGLQVGGGIKADNAKHWIECGADKVIITSFLFPNGTFSMQNLESISDALGCDAREQLVIDLSCRKRNNSWFVAMNKWQTLTNFEINKENICMLEKFCSEFLVHAADNEGLQRGIDEDLVKKLSEWCSIPVTYAGGAKSLEDLELVRHLSGGKVDLTIGSALDIFGGQVNFEACVVWSRENAP